VVGAFQTRCKSLRSSSFGCSSSARYQAERAKRRYRAIEPENRLVARTLETEWENTRHDQRTAEAELTRKEQEQRLQLTDAQREQIRSLGSDLQRVWNAPTTTDRDRRELLRSLLDTQTDYDLVYFQ